MIDNRSIRIGNYIKKKSEYIQVVSIAITNCLCEHSDGHHEKSTYGSVSHIPITDKILLACGFKKDGFGNYNLSLLDYDKMGMKILSFARDYLYIREGRKVNEQSQDDLITIWNKDIKKEFYLHELQNLYFDITGNELIVDAISL